MTEDVSQTEALLGSLMTHGISFVICFLLYIIVRPRFPLLYNFRNMVEEFKTPLAEEKHGSFQWIWRIFKYSDDDIFQHCGMDGIVLIRILRLGLKISLVGVFNALYLIPVYFSYVPDYGRNRHYDPLRKIDLSAVGSNSNALIATIVSAYVLFSSTMYFLFREFQWFTIARHEFLGKKRPDNYTVYVANIPKEYRSDIALLEYFQSIFDASDVIDAKIARDIPNLDKKIATREKAITNLERAIYLQNLKGIDTQSQTTVGENNPITACKLEIEELNSEISGLISQIEIRRRKEMEGFGNNRHKLSKIIPQSEDGLPNKQGMVEDTANLNSTLEEGLITDMVDLTINSAKAALKAGKETVKVADNIVHLLLGSEDEDGEPRDAGFVSFSRLLCKSQAIQILHDRVPYAFEVTNAPLPDYIFWHNVGLSHKKKLVGAFISNTLSAALCFIVFIPITVGVSFVNQSTVDTTMPPFIMKAVTLLTPLVLILLSVLVPPMLKYIGKYEGYISLTALEASLYSKYAIFLVIQNFFTQTFAYSILNEIDEFLKNTETLLTFLGTAVPKQVGILIQYVLVRTFLTCILELLRVQDVIFSLLRKILGPNKTENEQNSAWLGLSRLSVPKRLNYPVCMGYLMINFMCLFIFSCIAPIMSVILVFVFGLLNLTYRNQLIYIYSHKSDTGGQLWVRFVKLIIASMVVSECALAAIIFSKTFTHDMSTAIAYIYVASLVPLLVITVCFSRYLNKQHYRVSEYLPSISCQKEDRKNFNQDLSFVKGKYIQPALEGKADPLDGGDCASHDCDEQRNNSDTDIIDCTEKQSLRSTFENHSQHVLRKKKISFDDDCFSSGRGAPRITEK